MEKNHLIDGKNFSPNKLSIKRKINVGIVGSGKIAEEYIRIIKSFNHYVSVVVSPSKNLNIKKFKYLTSFEFEKTYFKFKNIDIWIVCTKWSSLKKYLHFFLKEKKPVLIEKSIIIKSSKIKKICQSKKIDVSNIKIAYNRNFYDYLPPLIKKIKNKKLHFIEANIFDPYTRIQKKNGKKIRPFLSYFISSHWVALILKIIELSNIKIEKIDKKIIKKDIQGNSISLDFNLKQKGSKFILRYNHLPNKPLNHSIKFFFENEIVELSPIETIKTHEKLDFINKGNSNIYKPSIVVRNVDAKFKPGFRSLYYNFVMTSIFAKKSKFLTNLKDLSKIYEICELIKK